MACLPSSICDQLIGSPFLWPASSVGVDPNEVWMRSGACELPQQSQDQLIERLVDPVTNASIRGLLLALAGPADLVNTQRPLDRRSTDEGTPTLVADVDVDESTERPPKQVRPTLQLQDFVGGFAVATQRRGDEETKVILAPIGWQRGPLWGDESNLCELVDRLSGAFGDQRHLLALCSQIPEQLNVDPIARSVSLWLASLASPKADDDELNKGEATYEGEICLELSLLDGDAVNPSCGPMMVIPPTRADDEVLALVRTIEATVREAASLFEQTPIIVTVDVDRWHPYPRGHLQETLYGRALMTCADQQGLSVSFLGSNRGAFAELVHHDLTSLWLIDSHVYDRDVQKPAQPVSVPKGDFVCRYDNPWSPHIAPAGPGKGFVQHATDGLDTVLMRWED